MKRWERLVTFWTLALKENRELILSNSRKSTKKYQVIPFLLYWHSSGSVYPVLKTFGDTKEIMTFIWKACFKVQMANRVWCQLDLQAQKIVTIFNLEKRRLRRQRWDMSEHFLLIVNRLWLGVMPKAYWDNMLSEQEDYNKMEVINNSQINEIYKIKSIN